MKCVLSTSDHRPTSCTSSTRRTPGGGAGHGRRPFLHQIHHRCDIGSCFLQQQSHESIFSFHCLLFMTIINRSSSAADAPQQLIHEEVVNSVAREADVIGGCVHVKKAVDL